MKTVTATILSAYFSWVSDLVIQGRFTDVESAVVKDIARARTLATLRVIEPAQKSLLVKFLYEAGLIGRPNSESAAPLIALNGADLTTLDCSNYQMDQVCIISAFLNRANFCNTFLYHANLSACDLIQADLSHANLDEANLLMADLSGANLQGASLRGTIVTDEQLAQAANVKDIQR